MHPKWMNTLSVDMEYNHFLTLMREQWNMFLAHKGCNLQNCLPQSLRNNIRADMVHNDLTNSLLVSPNTFLADIVYKRFRKLPRSQLKKYLRYTVYMWFDYPHQFDLNTFQRDKGYNRRYSQFLQFPSRFLWDISYTPIHLLHQVPMNTFPLCMVYKHQSYLRHM